jgi:ANTAR domain
MGSSAAHDGSALLARKRIEVELLRERVSQLETALESRVVIEQAKGILAARLDRPVEDAFELLRRAARSHRVRLHDLAAEVVAGRTVPPKITCLLYGQAIGRSTPNRPSPFQAPEVDVIPHERRPQRGGVMDI